MTNNLFFCDHCFKKNEDEKIYFECYQKQKFLKHIDTCKHKTKVFNAKKAMPSFYCEHCKTHFDSWGWAKHQERNQKYWDSISGLKLIRGKEFDNEFNQLTCNNFVRCGKRYPSFENMIEQNNIWIPPMASKEDLEKDRQKRIKILQERTEKLKREPKYITDKDGSTLDIIFTAPTIEFCNCCGKWVDEYDYGYQHLLYFYLRHHRDNQYYRKKFKKDIICRCETNTSSESDSEDEESIDSGIII